MSGKNEEWIYEKILKGTCLLKRIALFVSKIIKTFIDLRMTCTSVVRKDYMHQDLSDFIQGLWARNLVSLKLQFVRFSLFMIFLPHIIIWTSTHTMKLVYWYITKQADLLPVVSPFLFGYVYGIRFYVQYIVCAICCAFKIQLKLIFCLHVINW